MPGLRARAGACAGCSCGAGTRRSRGGGTWWTSGSGKHCRVQVVVARVWERCAGYEGGVGDGEVEEDEESVHFGNSTWAIGNVSMVEKLNELKNQGYNHEITDALDSNKGSVILLKSVHEVDHQLIDEFEDEHGPYWDLKDSSKIEYLKSFDEISPLYFRDDANTIKFTGV